MNVPGFRCGAAALALLLSGSLFLAGAANAGVFVSDSVTTALGKQAALTTPADGGKTGGTSAADTSSPRARVIVNFADAARDNSLSAAQVRTQIRSTRNAILAALPRNAWREIASFQRIGAVSLEIDASALAALRADPRVQSINLDREVQPMMLEANALTGIGAAHSAGLTGAGVRVAIIDSGVDSDHPGLANDLIAQRCFRAEGDCPNGNNIHSAEDQGGHGTHVAGIITGPQGAAPDAKFAALKVFTTGSTSDTNILASLDYVIENSGGAGLDFHLLNMSLGAGNYPDAASCNADNGAYLDAFSTLNAHGVSVFVATGNNALSNRVSSPACVDGAIGVGSSSDAAFTATFQNCVDNAVADKVSCYSNATPVQGEGELVDLLAPGCHIVSSGLNGSNTAPNCGTSMASPYATGVAAVVMQYLAAESIQMSPAELEDLLETTGTPVRDFRMAALPDGGPLFPRVNPVDTLGALALDPPAGFTLTSVSATAVSAAWSAVPAATRYHLYRSTDGGAFENIAQLAAGTVSYTDTTPPCGALRYHVRSFDGSLESLPSGIASGMSRACPASPDNLAVAAGSGDTAALSWRDNANDETGYLVERRSNGGAFATLLGGLAPNTQAAIDPQTLCALLEYRVVAVRNGDRSAASNVVAFAPCSPENDFFQHAEVVDGGAANASTPDYVDHEPLVSFATSSDGDPLHSCGFFGAITGDNGVWYAITPQAPVRVTIDTLSSTGAVVDTLLSVLTHDGNAFTELACNDDYEDYLSRIELVLQPGRTYYVLASQFSAIAPGSAGSLVTRFAFESGAPAIALSPATLDVSREPGAASAHVLRIGNSGGGPLLWSITDAAACGTAGDLPWLNAAPASGKTDVGEETDITVTLDSSNLGAGVANGALCIASNDAAQPVTTVPVRFEVLAAARIQVSRDNIALALERGQATSTTFTIGNSGDKALDWSLTESAADAIRATPRGYVSGTRATYASTPGHDRGSSTSSASTAVQQQALPGAQAGAIETDFSEGFDTVSTLPGAGWALLNRSAPDGTASWFQGNSSVFPASNGAANSYIAANFNSTAGRGTISNWLLTPEMTLGEDTVISFYTRMSNATNFPNRLEVRLSTAGDSTDVGTTATSVGQFGTLMTSVNPSLAVGGYPQVWTRVSITLTEMPENATGRLGLRYFVTDSGPAGVNGSYIGIDAFDVVQGIPSQCETPSDIGWLSVSPASGSTQPGAGSTVTLHADATGLRGGSHTAQVCIASNDNTRKRVIVPVTLTLPADPEVQITPALLPRALIDTVFSAQLSASGPGTTGPYLLSVVPGSMPPGLTLSPQGVLSGVPSQTGRFDIIVRAADSTPSGDGGPFVGEQSVRLEVMDEWIFEDGFELSDVTPLELGSSGKKLLALPLADALAAAGDGEHTVAQLLLHGKRVGLVQARCSAQTCEVRVIRRAANAEWIEQPWLPLTDDPFELQLDVGTRLLRSTEPAAR